ncbi:MAG: hypothetical protein H8M99_12820 [Gloeobacteraceae cyanobacterium ES-bin-144]|nr:hypothetical protein [Verrucomicrobiales bacterium]
MKIKNSTKFISLPFLAIALTAGTALAGTSAPAPVTPAPAEDVISASLTLAMNSHFISYGKDVWADGSSMSDLNFNPSLEFAFKLPNNFTLILGTWWDVTSKGDDIEGYPGLGGNLYEVDLWAGLAYTYDKFTVGVTYQSWLYGDDAENIVDVKFSYDCFLSPYLLFHNRVSEGASGGDNGTVAVLGITYKVDAGPVAISFPVNVAANLTDDYNGEGSDSGYAYTSAGAQFSYPLAFLGETYGEWSLNAGLTYYWTDNKAIPVNPMNHFLTYNFGLGATF